MGKKKLTQQQKLQLQENERYQKQQRSIQLLSIPNPLKRVSSDEGEFGSPRKANDGLHLVHEHPVITRDQPLPQVKKYPQNQNEVMGWNSSKDELNLAQHGLIDKKPDLYKGAINSKGSKEDQYIINKFKNEGDSDGGGFNLYSKNDLGEYVEEELLKEESGGESLKKQNENQMNKTQQSQQWQKEKIKQQKKHQTIDQNRKSFAQIVFSPSALKRGYGVGHANQYVEGVSPPPSQLSVVNFHNYQIQNSRRIDYSEDVIQRMQTHQMNKDSKKLQNERKNFDLIQINKNKKMRGSNHMATLSDFNKSFQQIGGQERIQSQEKQQQNKEDTNRSIQLLNQQSLNSPFTHPKQPNTYKQTIKDKIAFQQSSDKEFNEKTFENDYDELESDFKKQKKQSKLDTDPDNMRQSYYQQIQTTKSKKKSQLQIKEIDQKHKKKINSQFEAPEQKIKNFSQIEKKNAKNLSPDQSPLKNRNSNISIKQFETSQINSNSKHDVQKYVKDELEIFNTTKVNQRNNQTNFNTINEFGEIVERELNQKNNPENITLYRETDGMFMTLTSADIKGKHKPYQYVQKNIQKEQQDKIDKRLRYIMYTYTKNQEEIPRAMRQQVDNGGIRFLQEKSKFNEKGEKKQEDYIKEGIMNAQDQKISKMRNKLNHSVDLLTIQERVIEREKRKYNEKPIYKQVTNKLTFQNDQFLQNIDRILDPKNSPILPAIIANEKIKQERKSQLEENHQDQSIKRKDDNQMYSSSLPLVEEFSLQYEATKKQNFAQKKQPDLKIDISQAHNKYKESLKNQIKKKKQDKNGDVETFSKYSNESDLINENIDIKKEIQFEDLQEYTNLSELIEKTQEMTKYDDNFIESPIKQSKIIAMTKEKEEKEYNVVLNKKKQPKKRDSLIYIDLDNKQDDIKNQRIKIENIEEMEQIEKVFKMIHDYCAENLSVSYNMIDKHIDDILDPKVTVSPLLKYFNELAKHCNFRLPCLSLLQFDQKFFKAYVQRLRDAQKMEVRWVRQSVVNESREMLEYAFSQAKQLLQNEVKHVIYEYDLLKIKIKELEQTNSKLNETIYQQEMSLMEQRTYIQQLQQRSTAEDQELFKINNGPGGGYDRVAQGDVINNIDAYNQNLTKHLQDFAFFLKIQMAEKYEKDQQNERDGKSYLSQIKNSQVQNHDDKKKSALGIQGKENKLNYQIKKSQNTLQSQKEDEESQFQLSAKMSLFATLSRNIQNMNIDTSMSPELEKIQNDQIYQQKFSQKDSLPPLKKFYWEDDIPKIDEIQQFQLEPFLRSQYNLYGGLIRIKMQDVSEIMSNEMYKFQKVQINQLKENIESLKSENFAIHEMLNQYGITNQRLKRENEDYIQTISDMKVDFDKLTKKILQQTDKQIDEIEKKCKEDMRKLRSFLTLEINVATSIKDMIIDQNKWQAEKLRKFGTLLRVPRVHFEYIEKHGIDEFVDFCEDVMKRERALQENKESIQKRAELRNKFSIMKLKQQADKKSSPMALKYESLTDRIIEHPFRLEIKKPVEDLSKMDPQDLAQLKLQRQMEKINWLQKKSVLDLSELIQKHKDRQPELLAMISPDVKTQILSNPHFFQNLESLERKDPINQKVKDVKLFIQAIKSQTYDKHFLDQISSQDENKQSKYFNNIQKQRNKFSKSMNLKSDLLKKQLNQDIIQKFQNTTQTMKNSKGTSSSSQSKYKNSNHKNEEDFLETLLNQNTNIKNNPISPLDDEKIDPEEKLMLNQTSELNFQSSQENLGVDIQKNTIQKGLKKEKNVIFQNEQDSSVLKGNILNQNGNNTVTNHYYSTKLVRGNQSGNNAIFTEQKQKVQNIFAQNKIQKNDNANLDINKKNVINFRSNFNFGLSKHVKPSQYSNFLIKNTNQEDQQVNFQGKNPSNQILKQKQIGNINQQSSEMIDGSLQKFGFQHKINTLNAQNSPQMSIDKTFKQINDSITKMTVGNSSSQISSQLVVNMPFGAKIKGGSKIKRNKEANYRSVNISQKRISNIGEMDDTENTEYDEVNQ